MKRVVALIGDYYHPEEAIRESLQRALDMLQPEAGVSITFITYNELLEELQTKPDAVVICKENRLDPTVDDVKLWMTDEIADAIVQYVDNGGGWLAWHSGLASYPVEGPYAEMVRGYFKFHPKDHQRVQYKNNQEVFEFVDEHYFVYCDESNTDVFLRSESIDGASIAGWRHAFGKGKVCCLTPAHNKEGLLDEGFLRILGQSTLWCC